MSASCLQSDEKLFFLQLYTVKDKVDFITSFVSYLRRLSKRKRSFITLSKKILSSIFLSPFIAANLRFTTYKKIFKNFA